MRLLVNPPDGAAPQQQDLERAIADIDALQLAELENFLGCNLASSGSINQNLNEIDRQSAFLYPIVLADRLEVIYKLPQQPLQHFSSPVVRSELKTTVAQLQRAILRRNVSVVRRHGGQIYEWLLKPLEQEIAQSDIATLVFVLDSDLRNVSMSALFDTQSQEYLVQKPYALALLPSAQLFDLSTPPSDLRVLGAGITTKLTVGDRNFDALNARQELDQVEQSATSTILLDQAFNQPNLQRNLSSGNYSVVHLATHGSFSSDPASTFLLAYNPDNKTGTLLTPNDLNQLLQSTDQTTRPLELLVLSACQTATGDNRAVLGLAGLAVRSGARSTLASLWQVSDDSTVQLMEQFYQNLTRANVTKAEALHQAQQFLLSQPKSQNPFHWAAFVLVGNWL